jgi:hypothetical protein
MHVEVTTERIKMNKEKSLITLAEENNASPSMKEALKILDKWKRIDLAFRVIELTERVVDLKTILQRGSYRTTRSYRPATLKAARNFLTRLASVKLQAASLKQQATSCRMYKQ